MIKETEVEFAKQLQEHKTKKAVDLLNQIKRHEEKIKYLYEEIEKLKDITYINNGEYYDR